MRQKYFTKEEKKAARKRWNKAYYEKNKLLIQLAKRQILELEQQEQKKQNTKV